MYLMLNSMFIYFFQYIISINTIPTTQNNRITFNLLFQLRFFTFINSGFNIIQSDTI